MKYLKEDITLDNEQLQLGFNRAGGALSRIQHHSSGINPLNFHLQRSAGSEQFFTGHFICTPRWGDVTPGEAAMGLTKHGDICDLDWSIERADRLSLVMQVKSEAEQLAVIRTVELKPTSPVFSVSETIQNLSPVYRPCNLVQHPTIAAPFLHAQTRIDCNGSTGWRDAGAGTIPVEAGTWPLVYNTNREQTDLRTPGAGDSGVYSFTIPGLQTGWVTAFDPVSKLLLGYCWPGQCYPFIHHWIHAEEGIVKYRGLEFGTAAIHQPFSVQQDLHFYWEEKTTHFLDAGASATFQYDGFLCRLDDKATGVKALQRHADRIELEIEGTEAPLILSTI